MIVLDLILNLKGFEVDFKTHIMNKPPPPCECGMCYLAGWGDGVSCPEGKKIENQWKEYYMIRRFEKQLRIERERVERQIALQKIREKQRKKKRFYNFIFYASLLYIIVLKLKWDIKYYLNPNLFL